MSVGVRLLLVSIFLLALAAVATDHWAWVLGVYVCTATFATLRFLETKIEERLHR